jgi:uncharacterized protein YegJ (DUF2314 family)
MEEQGEQKETDCATHGRAAETFLCRHLIENVGLEFHRDDPSAENPYPDAWCQACEKTRRRAGGWDRLNHDSAPAIGLVCGHCYDFIRLRHRSVPTTLLARLRRIFAPPSPPRPAFKSVLHTEPVLAASRRARDRLRAELKPRFIAGLSSGEQLMVKAPFMTPAGGREWMWVRVSRWQGPRIHGVLENDPVHVRDLKAGAHVDVLEEDVLDYLFFRGDGAREGNETGALMHGNR